MWYPRSVSRGKLSPIVLAKTLDHTPAATTI